MKRFLILAVIIPGLFSSALSQDIPENINLEGRIYGQVINLDTGDPVEYATVALYNLLDNSVETGTVTDAKGNFNLEKISLGAYNLEITFVGYKKTRINRIIVRPKQDEIFLGNIELEPLVQELEEVTVTGEKQEVLYKIDRKVINIDQDVVAKGGTVVDALEGMPSIKTDMEGNLSLRGSANYTVLIDGKPSILKGSDALQQIPANTVERVEIITSPSAKYDTEGEVGIINIIMKKDFSEGVSGMVGVSYGSGNRYIADGLLNVKFDDLTLFASVDAKNRPMNGHGTFNRETYTSTGNYTRRSDMHIQMERQTMSLKTGASYNLNARNYINWEVTTGQQDFLRRFDSDIFSEGDSITRILAKSDFNRSPRILASNINYQHLFDLTGHKLDASLHFALSNPLRSDVLNEDYATDNWVPASNALYQESLEDGRLIDIHGNIDYVRPFKSGKKLEAGYQGREEHHDLSQQFVKTGGEPSDDVHGNNNLGISRHIHAGYGLFSGENGGFGYKVGLRAEMTGRNIDRLNGDYGFSKTYYSLFPSLHLSRSWNQTNQLQLGYTRRINRPVTNRLNPYPQFMDNKNRCQGNPELNPEYINAFEINYLKRVFMSFISVEAFYRQTTGKISPVWAPVGEDELLLTYNNRSKDFAAGAEMMATLQLAKWLRIIAGSSLYRYSIEGSVFGGEVNNASNSWNIRFGATLRLSGTGTKIQLNSIYNGVVGKLKKDS